MPVRRASPPQPPWRLPRLPEVFEVILVAQRIHGLPEPGMPERGQLAFIGELWQRPGLPSCGIALDAVDDRRLEDEIAAIDDALVPRRLLDEAPDALAVD